VRIAGFEGSWEQGDLIACATAAIEDGEFYLNPVTKRRVSLAEAERLVEDRHLHLFPQPIEIKDTDAPLTVVAIRRSFAAARPFLVDTGRTGGLAGHSGTKGEQFYLFGSQNALEQYREEVCTRVLELSLAEALPHGVELAVLARWATALHPQNPFAQALRVFCAGNKPHVRKVARSMVAEHRRASFDQLTDALTTSDLDYILKYEKGAASGGGFDIDVASSTLRSMSQLHDLVKPLVQDRYPFLGDHVPAPRFKTLVAASAEFHFATHVEGRPWRERVARHIELDLFRQVLRGERPSDLDRSEKLERAVAQLANPTPDTFLSQGIGDQREAVEAPPPPPSVIGQTVSPTFTVLAYLAGIAHDARRAELRIFPGFTVLTPITADIQGQETLGLDYISAHNDFLRVPIAATLRKNTHPGRPETYSLLALRPIAHGTPVRIDAFPSSVFRDALVLGQSIQLVRADAATIHSPLGGLQGVDATGKDEAAAWMRAYAELCAGYELGAEASLRLRFLLPQSKRSVSALGRVLIALGALGGASLVSNLVTEINRMNDASVRVNNTRREVYRHPELLEFDEANDQIMKLTDLGKLFYSAYLSAKGEQGGA